MMIGLMKGQGTYVVSLGLALCCGLHRSSVRAVLRLSSYLAFDNSARREDAPAAVFGVAVEPTALVFVSAWSRVVIHFRHHFL